MKQVAILDIFMRCLVQENELEKILMPNKNTHLESKYFDAKRGNLCTWVPKYFWVAFYMGFVLLGWLIPSDVLHSTESLQHFTDAMAHFIPQIDRVTVLGAQEAGQSNRLLYSILWVTEVPVLMFIFLVCFFQNIYRKQYLKPNSSVWESIGMILLFLWMLPISLHLTGITATSWLAKISMSNQFVAGLWAPLLAFSPSFWILGIGVYLLQLYLLLNKRKR